MSTLDLIKTPDEIALQIAKDFKHARKFKHITQKELSEQSGVSFGSVKRFEQTGEISFISLIKISRVIDQLDCFDNMFKNVKYESIEDLLNDK